MTKHQASNNVGFLLIAGVHKAGTSSLYQYLSRHPQIASSHIKETHFFTPLRFGGEVLPIANYRSLFSPTSHTKYCLEASPSYLYGGKALAVQVKKSLQAEVKSIIILRNPVSRFISFYKAAQYTQQLPAHITLEEFANESLAQSVLPLADSIQSRGIREGYYIDYLPEWMDELGEQSRVLFFEDFIQNPQKTVTEIFDWLGLDSFRGKGTFEVENKSRKFRNRTLHKIGMDVNRRVSPLLKKTPGAKSILRTIYGAVNTSSEENLINERLVAYLANVYQEKNRHLKKYLEAKGLVDHLPHWLS